MSYTNTLRELRNEIYTHGFVRATPATMRELLGPAAMGHWASLKSSWDDLPVDDFMADGGTYRRRRFATFLVGPDFVKRTPHRAHYQDRKHNPLNGGIERWFAPIKPSIADTVLIHLLLRATGAVFEQAGAPCLWNAEMHQFRIKAVPDDGPGLPTPEGLHRDGVDWVFMMLIDRSDIVGGVSRIHAADGTRLSSFILEEPLEAIFLNDAHVLHGVTPIYPLSPTTTGHRDVLVITFSKTRSQQA